MCKYVNVLTKEIAKHCRPAERWQTEKKYSYFEGKNVFSTVIQDLYTHAHTHIEHSKDILGMQ